MNEEKFLQTDSGSLYDYEREDWRRFCEENGWEAYRGDQIMTALRQGKNNPEAMTGLPKELRACLKETLDFRPIEPLSRLVSALDGTVKYLLRLRDGSLVEAALMHYRYGASLCLSTQAGCRMGCTFCASAKLGFERNLSAGELLEQLCVISAAEKKRIRNVVLMGIGEPLDNLGNVLRFVELVSSPEGPQISKRRIAISTCGLVPQIRYLAGLNLPFTLSISLHAPTQEQRLKIMPIARRFDLDSLLEACGEYLRRGGKRISFEYIMLRDFNDREEDAKKLIKKVGRLLCHVNLIPANEVPGSPYRPSSRSQMLRFQKILENAGISCTLRRSLGQDIMAACGQLRRGKEEEKRGETP